MIRLVDIIKTAVPLPYVRPAKNFMSVVLDQRVIAGLPAVYQNCQSLMIESHQLRGDRVHCHRIKARYHKAGWLLVPQYGPISLGPDNPVNESEVPQRLCSRAPRSGEVEESLVDVQRHAPGGVV